MLLLANGQGDPYGEMAFKSLTLTSSGTTGSVAFTGYDGRPSFTGTVVNTIFSGDTISGGGNITGGGTFRFSGIIFRFDDTTPNSYELAPLDFKAFDSAGNPTLTFEPGTIAPSFTGSFTTFVGCN